ncbi:hypothetical protein Tco_1244128 [Tanacetum coccineum]
MLSVSLIRRIEFSLYDVLTLKLPILRIDALRIQSIPLNLYTAQVNWVHVLDFAGLTEEMGINDTELGLDVADTLCLQLGGARHPVRRLCHKLISYSISGRGQAPKKVTATDLFYLRSMDQGMANFPYLLAQYLFRHAQGRKSGARMSGGYFIGRLAEHIGLISDEGLMGLSVIARMLPVINLDELVKLNICVRLGDTWAWVAPGSKFSNKAY